MQRFKVNLPVFVGSVAVIALFVGIGVIAPKRAESIFSGMQTAILSGFGWLYLLSVAVFLFSMLFLAFSRYGELKLGRTIQNPSSGTCPGSPCCLPPAWALASCNLPSASR